MKPRKSKTVTVGDVSSTLEGQASPPPTDSRVSVPYIAPPPEPAPVDVCPVDLTPVRRAAEAAGFGIYTIEVCAGRVIVTAGQAVIEGDDVAALAEAIRAYNCKHCGSGGSHTPNCGRPR